MKKNQKLLLGGVFFVILGAVLKIMMSKNVALPFLLIGSILLIIAIVSHVKMRLKKGL